MFTNRNTETIASTFEDEEDGLDTDELIAAVSESAQQGIALFSQWLGLNLNPKQNTSYPAKNTQSVPTNLTSTRSERSMLEVQQEESEENLKQLLIAQDNVLKESAKIEQTGGIHTTFVYSKIDNQHRPVQAESVPVVLVPRESRRGGRAYNIQQHVNEI